MKKWCFLAVIFREGDERGGRYTKKLNKVIEIKLI